MPEAVSEATASPDEPTGFLARIRNRLTPSGWTALGTAVVLLYSIYRRSVDLNPGSLWLDDAWVAVLARGSLGDLLAHGSTSPPIFNLLVALSIWTLPDIELAAQLVPFLSGLLAIAATAWAAFLLTRSAPCALFAAVVYACDPFAIEYAARVKQYSSDALVCVLELGAFHMLLDRFTRRRLWAFAGLVTVGLFLSTLSVFVAAVLVPVALLTLYRRQEHSQVPTRELVAVGAVTLVAALVLYAVFLRGIDSAATARHWAGGYLPADGFLPAVGGLMGFWADRLLGGASPNLGAGRVGVPGAEWIGAVLLLCGAAHLWLSGLRAHLVAAAAIPTLMVVASVAERLPLGSGRVELFFMPLLACACACGVALALRLRNRRVQGFFLGLALVFAFVALPSRRTVRYPVQDAAPVVAAIAKEWKPGGS